MNFYLEKPDFTTIFTENSEWMFQNNDVCSREDVELLCCFAEKNIKITLRADQTPIRFIRLHWVKKLPEEAIFLGEAWERTYGDSQWRTHDSSRMMPWYFFMNTGNLNVGYGVKVRPGAFALWNEDPHGITLWLDVRNGTKGVVLQNRILDVATVVSEIYQDCSSFEAARKFCKLMCKNPLLPDFPVYGGNNWYYAYGDSSHEEILKDSRYLASLCEGLQKRPFMVIDDGWQALRIKTSDNSGPWDCGNEKYPDMIRLAQEMRECGVRPGIWIRPLWNLDPAIPETWLLDKSEKREKGFMDPSIPDVISWIQNDIRRLADWGYELIKHDFTTHDIFGKYAHSAKPWLATGNWSFADRSRSTAEIIKSLYQAILDAAGNTIILGCNTIGHLGAGLMHLARTGDDTSGLRWERTRKMGVNTLAFRLCQHKTFFDADADCVGIAGEIPWQLNRQWAELLAKSGTSFFASVRPDILNKEEFEELKIFFAIASRQNSEAVPLDWQTNTTPEHWILNGEQKNFNWSEPEKSGCPEFI